MGFACSSDKVTVTELTIPRKQAVSSQSTELEQLKARLKATETRLLERQSRSSSCAPRSDTCASTSQPAPVSGALSVHQKESTLAALISQQAFTSKRPFIGNGP